MNSRNPRRGAACALDQTVTSPTETAQAPEIASLVDEVLEQERRLHAHPVEAGEHSKHHFKLHHLTYNTRTSEQELTPKNGNGQVRLFTRGYINFESQPKELERTTTFSGALDGKEYIRTTTVHYNAYTVADVVQRLRGRLKSIDAEGETTYAREWTASKLRKIIETSLKRVGEKRGVVLEQNLQHAYRAMGNTQRRVAKTVRIELEADQLFSVSTKEMRSRSAGIGAFRKEATVFCDSESLASSGDADRRVLDEITDPDAPYPRHAARLIDNKYHFKSPVNVVLTTHRPERTFVRKLFEPAIADSLEAWVKAPDVGFYEIDYSWRKGDHTKQGKFNPDMFLNLSGSDDILAVELKDDGDSSDENKAKLRFAQEHFERVNGLQEDATYHIKFVSPQSYDAFFQALRDGKAVGFQSSLQADLEN